MIRARTIFLDFFSRHQVRIGYVFIAGLCASLIAILIPLVMGRYFAFQFGYASTRARVLAWLPDAWFDHDGYFLAAIGLLVLFWFAFRYVERYQTSLLGEWMVQGLREKLFHRQLHADPQAFGSKSAGKYLLRYSGDLKAVQNFFNLGILAFARDLLVLVPASALLFWMLPEIVLPALICTVGILLPLMLLNRKLYQVSLKRRDQRSGLLAFVSERLYSFGTIQALNRATPEYKKFQKRSRKLTAAGAAYFRVEALIRILIRGLVYLAPGLLFLWLQFSANAGGYVVDPELFSLSVLLLLAMAPVFRRMGRVTVHWELGKLSMRKLLKVMNQPLAEAPGNPAFQYKEGKIEAKGLSFAYPGREALFDGWEAVLGDGALTWVQGGTGAGKTTLMRLLLGLEKPATGHLLIDDQAVDRVQLKTLRKKIAVVSDAWPLLGRTVFEAISYSRKQEKRFAASAMLARVQRGLPAARQLELDDAIGDHGRHLSAGERMLLQFARAFLTRKPLLVLDEPFRDLDPASRTNIIKMLQRLAAKRRIVVLSKEAPPLALKVDDVVELGAKTSQGKLRKAKS